MDFKEIGCDDVDLIQLSQNRAQWWDLMNTAMKLWFCKRRGVF
jgi:hypothetical protein